MADAGFFTRRKGAMRIGRIRASWELTEAECVLLLTSLYYAQRTTDEQIKDKTLKDMKTDLRTSVELLGSCGVSELTNKNNRAELEPNPLVARLVKGWD